MPQTCAEICHNITFITGDEKILTAMPKVKSLEPFAPAIIDFTNKISQLLLADRSSRMYPEVITLAYWLRKANMQRQKERFALTDANYLRRGCGVVFHVAPSNVPVNYAYSLAVGLLTGNANIVRLPSKEFPQVQIINTAIAKAIVQMPLFASYICLVRYGHQQETNDMLTELADVRVIWGGDATIREIRRSPLKPRATEITFADRYSISVIDADTYLQIADKKRTAEEFYNDTYLTDQNACTSPKLIVWLGKQIAVAQKEFWRELQKLIDDKYTYQPITGVNKLTSMYLLAANRTGVKKEDNINNLLVRVAVAEVTADLMAYQDKAGYFLEYSCEDIKEIACICTERCQTIGYIGNKQMLLPLLESGIKGVDRIVPIGKTMDFDFIWDGYDLVERLSRLIYI